METNQLQLLSKLAKKIKAEDKDKAQVVTSLQNAGILTKSGNFTGNYKELKKVFVNAK